MQAQLTGVVLLITLFFPVSTFALSGNVSGRWEVADSPIIIDGETTVETGTNLTIEPGVVVRVTGPFNLVVNGTLTAVGTKEQPILFSRATVGQDSRWGGIMFVGADSSSTLEHCTIEYAGSSDVDGLDQLGGGIHINGCSPTIRYCTIRNNLNTNEHGNGSGGGIFIYGGSTSLIELNHFTDNIADSGGAICVGGESWPVLSNNRIENNSAYSSGGGIYISAWAEATIDSNIIRNNSAGYWGGGGLTLWNNTCSGGDCMDVFNNLLYGNTTPASGGGIYCRYNRTNQFNNTIYGNSAGVEGGGVYVLNQGNTYPTIVNSIIRGNSAPSGPQIALHEMTGSTGNLLYSAAEVYFSNIEGGWSGAGAGNIDGNPHFLSPEMGLFRLTAGAAGIDMGDNSQPNLPDYDLVGRARVLDGDGDSNATVDMGSYEYDPEQPLPGDVDRSGDISLADTILLLRLLSGNDNGLADHLTETDANGDGVIGLAEALFTLQYVAR